MQLDLTGGVQWLSEPVGGSESRLFTSQVERLRATYTFNAKTFLRAILQNNRTNRQQSLYTFDVDRHSGSLGTQLLWAYKVNWQTVMYVGYGDVRGVMAEEPTFQPLNRQFFLKISYAFQR